MRISGVELKTFTESGQQACLLVLESDAGLSGVGELGISDAARDGKHSAATLRELLVGRDPFEIEALTTDVKVSGDGSGPDLSLLSAATSAMLDLAAQSLEVPAYQLLGGRVRDHVRACAVGWAANVTSSATLVEHALRTIEQGYTVLRIEPLAQRSGLGRSGLEQTLEVVRILRDALPDEIDLVVAADPDPSDPTTAEFERALATFEPLWLEQPISATRERHSRSTRTLARAAGRGMDGVKMRTLARTSTVDHLVLELGRLGGLVEARRIAALAEVYYTGVVPVGSGSAFSLRAALQLAAVVPNLSLVEVRPGLARVENGLIAIDDLPGLASTLPVTEVR